MNSPVATPFAAQEDVRPMSRIKKVLPVLFILPAITLVLSGIITFINLGFANGFLGRWLKAFLVVLPVVPFVLIVMVVLERPLLRALGRKLPDFAIKLILAVLTASAMELILSTVVTLTNLGAGAGFMRAWSEAFLKSLPMGFAVGLLMSFAVKPWLGRRAVRLQAQQN